MSSGRKRRFWHALAFRLSLTYACCCFVTMVGTLIVCYLSLDGTLRSRMDAGLLEEVVEFGNLLKTQRLEVLNDVLQREANSEGTDRVFFRILDKNGLVVIGTDTNSWGRIAVGQSHLESALSGKPVFTDMHVPARDFHARILYGKVSGDLVLQLGESLAENHDILEDFKDVFTLATVTFVLVSLFAGAYMANRALSGVQAVTRAADEIAAGAWAHRVPVSPRNDELDELAAAFNSMVDRIQVLFRELREVTDDIAHDLRTPLMRIRGEAELALRDAGAASGVQESIGSVLEECDRMLNLINTMLEISQTEAGAERVSRASLELGGVIEDVVELFAPAAEDKGIRLESRVADSFEVIGDASRLKRALAHLVDNAIKYTPRGGMVGVGCRTDGDTVFLEVVDTGAGIPADKVEKIFDRFYRVESSRTTAGNGLGLSLARAIVRAHGGDIAVTSVPGRGSTFRIALPR